MAKLYFTYSTMNSGKSTALLQARFNYIERGMEVLLVTAAVDNRFGMATIASRLGISAPAETFGPNDDMIEKFVRPAAERGQACILIDEIQFATEDQIWQLARGADSYDIPIMCYGLRTDFLGRAFAGSACLLAIADELREMRTICHCGKKATMVLRTDQHGRVMTSGAQVEIGGNERYVSLCRKHWLESMDEARQTAPLNRPLQSAS